MSEQPSRTPIDDTLPLTELALESMPFPMNIYRPDGVIIAANIEVERLFHYPRHLSINIYNLYDDPNTVANGFRDAFDRARAGETVSLPPNAYDPVEVGMHGTSIWYIASIFPFASSDGVTRFIGGVYQDVTAQIEAEAESARLTEELARHAREFQPFYILAENAPDGFLLAGMDRHITYVNHALKAMTGYGDTIIEHTIADLVQGVPGAHMSGVEQALVAMGTWQGEGDFLCQNGDIIPIHSSIMLIRDEFGNPLGMAAVVRDLRDQRQAEAERVALQEQVIVTQQAALRELSTPLIPLTDTVVVMPLVGSIDSTRAQQIMETLLEGISAYQAEVVLLDISGVRIVDTQVADALLRAARAVKLLGAQVVLTGIRAEIAQTMVHLGADMSHIVTLANLQSGLRYVMARSESSR